MLHILITEDDDTLIGLYKSLLKSFANCRTTYARTAEESRSLLSSEHFDLALFDINLGAIGGEGIGLLDYVSDHDASTIAVMMSTQDDPQTRKRCAAAHTFVTKNAFFASQLADLLASLCQQIQTECDVAYVA